MNSLAIALVGFSLPPELKGVGLALLMVFLCFLILHFRLIP